jgi:hypothetical protein
MANDVSTSDDLRGLILHDPRIKTANLDAAESSYTQASPRPGVPEDQNSPRSAMVFQTSGNQAAGQQLRLRIGAGGYPGTDARGAGGLWKLESDTDWYGADVYNVISGREFLEYVDNSVGTDDNDDPHVCRLEDGSVMAAYHHRTALAGSQIRIRTMTPGNAWAVAADLDPTPSSLAAADMNPCLLVLPGGRVALYYWTSDTTANVAQVQMQYSDDGGTTWTLGSTACLETSIDISSAATGYYLGRIRMARSSGQILLVAELVSRDGGVTTPDVLTQWASDDEGVTFSHVQTWVPDVNNGQQPSVLAAQAGGFIVFVADALGSGTSMYRLSSAYEALTDAGTTSMTGLTAGSEVIDCFRDEDATLYLLWYNVTDAVQIVRSVDDGLNWTHLDDDSTNAEAFWHANDANTMLSIREFSATALEGRMVVVCKFLTATGTKDDESILCLYGGGSSTVTLPSSAAFRRDANQMAYRQTWTDIEKPGDVASWTRSATGSPTETLTSGGFRIETGAGSSVQYLYNMTADPTLQIVVTAELDVQAAAAVGTSTEVGFQVHAANSTDQYRADIRFSNDGFAVVDGYGGTTLGQSSGLDTTNSVQVLVSVTAEKVRTFYRLTGTASDNARSWTAGPAGTLTASPSLPPIVNNAVEWGHLATTGAGRDSFWRLFLVGELPATASPLYDGFTNPTDLFARPLSRHPIGIDGGVKVAAIDGPGREAETWNIDTRYDYSVEHLDPAIAPSPRRRWRTTGETQQDLVWDLHGLAADARYGSTTLGLYLGGINWRTGSLWGKANGGSWVKLGDLDAASGMQPLAYTRTGDAIGPNLAGSVNAAQYLQRNEFAGGSFASSTSVIRRIIRHTEGAFSNSLTRRATLFLEGVTDSDPTSGDGAIWSPRLLAIAHNVGDYRYLRLRIDAQTTADGYFEIGACVLGPLALFGTPYSWGRVIDHQANVELTTARDGTRYARGLGDPRRQVSFSWSEGVDTSATFSSTGSGAIPDYITGTATGGAQPIGTPYDTPLLLSGVLSEINGAATPLVYVPAIARGPSDFAQYPQRAASVYCRMTTPVRVETVLGDESSTEVMRLLNVELSEEV